MVTASQNISWHQIVKLRNQSIWSKCSVYTSINFNLTIDFIYENVTRVKRNSSSETRESDRDKNGVSKVQKARHERTYLQFIEEVEEWVQQNVKATTTTNDKTSPPPMVVLSTQLKKDKKTEEPAILNSFSSASRQC